MSIVKPETILTWQRRLEKQKWDYSAREKRGPGQPRTPGDIEAIVCRMARENTWGYKRIHGELLKLNIKLSYGCIADILRQGRSRRFRSYQVSSACRTVRGLILSVMPQKVSVTSAILHGPNPAVEERSLDGAGVTRVSRSTAC